MIEIKINPLSDSFNTYNPDGVTFKIRNSDVELEINYPEQFRKFRIDKNELVKVLRLIEG